MRLDDIVSTSRNLSETSARSDKIQNLATYPRAEPRQRSRRSAPARPKPRSGNAVKGRPQP